MGTDHILSLENIKDNRIIQIKEQKDKEKNESFQITTIVVVCFYNCPELGFCLIVIWHSRHFSKIGIALSTSGITIEFSKPCEK